MAKRYIRTTLLYHHGRVSSETLADIASAPYGPDPMPKTETAPIKRGIASSRVTMSPAHCCKRPGLFCDPAVLDILINPDQAQVIAVGFSKMIVCFRKETALVRPSQLDMRLSSCSMLMGPS